MKRCSKCKVNLPLDYFNKDKSKKDGLHSQCKNCLNGKVFYFGQVRSDEKVCSSCGLVKPLTEFFKSINGHKGVRGECKKCKLPLNHSLEQKMLYSAKRRSKLFDRDFNITLEDIVIPKLCPLLKIPLHKGSKVTCDNSPTLDRLDSSKGYVKGNVWVISHKANTIKRDLTVEEIELLLNNLKTKLNEK